MDWLIYFGTSPLKNQNNGPIIAVNVHKKLQLKNHFFPIKLLTGIINVWIYVPGCNIKFWHSDNVKIYCRLFRLIGWWFEYQSKAPPISSGYGILTFLFGIYHDGKILFVKTLEMLLPAVVSGYHRMSWSGGWSNGLWSSFLRAAQYWQTVPSIPTQLIILNVFEVFALLNIVQFWKHLTSFPNDNGFLKHCFSDAGADCWEWCGREKFDDSEILPGNVHQGT